MDFKATLLTHIAVDCNLLGPHFAFKFRGPLLFGKYMSSKLLPPKFDNLPKFEGLSRPEISILQRFHQGSLSDKDDESVGSFDSLGSFGTLCSNAGSLASGVTIAPFFYSKTPTLPNVDCYIQNSQLTYDKLVSGAPSATRLRRRKKKKAPLPQSLDTTTADIIDNIDVEDSVTYGGYKSEEIQHLVDYIHECSGKTGEITLDEMEIAFRKYRHANLHGPEEDHARELMAQFHILILQSEHTPVTWFQASKPHHHSSMTWHDLVEAMRVLCARQFSPMFDHKDLEVLHHYMDPNADGDLEEREIIGAFRRLHHPGNISLKFAELEITY